MEKTVNAANRSCSVLYQTGRGIPIVFLHGFSYTIDIWQHIGIITTLTKKQIPFLALDMPYGLKSKCYPKTKDPETNLTVVSEAFKSMFGSAVPVLVGASLGGYIALRYAAVSPVKGLFLVSPTRVLDESLVQAYSNFMFPVTIIWGSRDNIVSGEDMKVLADKLPNANLIVYEGASHSAYKDQPEKFSNHLLQFYARAEQREF